MRKSTCKECGKVIDDPRDKFVYSGKTHCEKCYDDKIEHKLNYDALVREIHNYFKLETMNTLILKQIKDYTTQLKFSINGIRYCLYYITVVKNIKLEVKFGIAMVKYEYDNSKNYFNQQNRVNNSLTDENLKIKIIHKEAIHYKKDKKINVLFDLDVIN